MEKDVKKQFGKNIVNLRKERNLSQEDLAGLSNLHRTYIGSVERGERNISIEAISQIAKAFKVDLSELFKGIKIYG